MDARGFPDLPKKKKTITPTQTINFSNGFKTFTPNSPRTVTFFQNTPVTSFLWGDTNPFLVAAWMLKLFDFFCTKVEMMVEAVGTDSIFDLWV